MTTIQMGEEQSWSLGADIWVIVTQSESDDSLFELTIHDGSPTMERFP